MRRGRAPRHAITHRQRGRAWTRIRRGDRTRARGNRPKQAAAAAGRRRGDAQWIGRPPLSQKTVFFEKSSNVGYPLFVPYRAARNVRFLHGPRYPRGRWNWYDRWAQKSADFWMRLRVVHPCAAPSGIRSLHRVRPWWDLPHHARVRHKCAGVRRGFSQE